MVFIRWIVYSNIWVSFVAPSMLWSTSILFGKQIPPALYIFVFSATLFTYNIQRLYKASDYLAPETLQRHRWIWEHRKALQSITWLAACVAFITTFFIPFNYLLWLFPGIIISVLYFIPFLPNGNESRRLRDIPLLKIVLVGFVWAWVCVASVAMTWEVPFEQWALLFCFQFMFCFALTVPFDIRDAKFDREEGTVTFVSQLGIQRAKWLSTICLLISLFFLWLFSIQPIVFVGIASYVCMSMIFVWCTSPQRNELYYGFVLDGLFVFQGTVVFAVNISQTII